MLHLTKGFSRKLIGVFLLGLFSLSASALVVDYSPGTSFKVIQDQITFNSSTVKSATVIPPRSVVDHVYRVRIVLNDAAATKLLQLSKSNVGKQALIIIDGHVVSAVKIMTSLKNKFEISGFTKAQAEQLVKSFGV